MTQIELAQNKKYSPQMRIVSKTEGMPLDHLRKMIAQGRIIIPCNPRHKSLKKFCGIGEGLKTKINVNIGTSTDESELEDELKKLRLAVSLKADAVMDLSLGGDLRNVRKAILDECPVPLGTVPIYEAAQAAKRKKGSFLKMTTDDIFRTLEDQAKEGVDFFTIHSGVNQKTFSTFKKSRRVMDIVSRGGAILINWMKFNKSENPLYEYFDRVLKLASAYDITLSLGDGMRPGSILDATDKLQIEELRILGELFIRAKEHGVSAMIEGPGHVQIGDIKRNVMLEKKLCHGAPFYVLGPLVTDIAPGYDHITSAIGAALAGSYGADFLCYVTPSEHLRHPSIEDVHEGIIASKIAAHAADLAKGNKIAFAWDRQLSNARRKRDWKEQINLAIDPKKANLYRTSSKPEISDVCTMCSEYCSIRLVDECIN